MNERLTQTVEWIPTSERLPAENRIGAEYPVAFGAGRYTSTSRFYDGYWHYADEDRIHSTPTHWAEPLMHPSALSDERVEG